MLNLRAEVNMQFTQLIREPIPTFEKQSFFQKKQKWLDADKIATVYRQECEEELMDLVRRLMRKPRPDFYGSNDGAGAGML